MTTTPQTEAQRLAASISETLDSQDDSYLTCSVTKCLLQQAATELLRLDALRLELQTQLADYKEACTKAETRAVPASTGMHWTENEPVRLPQARTGRVYLAGPMTGLPELNFPAFNQEADRLRAEGLQVLNPADHGIVDGADWADYLRHDITGLASCERIHLLRGWTKSKGACLEMTIAKALGMAVTYQFDAEMEHNNAPAVPQGEPVDFDSIIEDVEAIDCRYRGDPSYDRDPYYIREEAANVVRRHATYYATPAPAPAVAQNTDHFEDDLYMVAPFGYFRPEPFGWTDCAEDDECAIALYERPQEVGLTDEEIVSAFWSAYRNFPSTASALTHTVWKDGIDIDKLSAPTMAFARAIIAALRAKGASK